ncbi:MAG: hypothetical protein ABI186_07365 [Candidatus Elarobacter sp.]
MTRPLLVAIGGDSGTGKAAVCAGLRALLGDARVALIATRIERARAAAHAAATSR